MIGRKDFLEYATYAVRASYNNNPENFARQSAADALPSPIEIPELSLPEGSQDEFVNGLYAGGDRYISPFVESKLNATAFEEVGISLSGLLAGVGLSGYSAYVTNALSRMSDKPADATAFTVLNSDDGSTPETLVIGLTGTNSLEDAVVGGQAFTADGQAEYFGMLVPFLQSAKAYAEEEGINDIIVAGHSLGGSMADIFSLMLKPQWEESFDVNVYSFASAGVVPGALELVGALLNFAPEDVPETEFGRYSRPSNHLNFANTEDPVPFPVILDENGRLEVPDVLVDNIDLPGAIQFDQLEMSGTDVASVRDFIGGGAGSPFGPEHSYQLYIDSVTAAISVPGFDISEMIGDGLAVGSAGSDEIVLGDTAFNSALGQAGSDRIFGTNSDNLLAGDAGDDTLSGGRGEDILDGGPGFDTAVFSFVLSEAEVASTDLGARVTRNGSVTELISIEQVEFTDVVLSLEELLERADSPVDDGDGDDTPVTPPDDEDPALGGIALVAGLGGDAGFGENVLNRNDDGSTGEIDITSVFEDGLNFFGREFDSLWVNNNGSVTFNGARSAYTPNVITEESNNPEITPFFADVDTRGGATDATSGGNSTGSNLVYYDFDTNNDRLVVTWDDVGYFGSNIDKLNAFQLILSDQGNGDFDIEFRYENIDWTTGDASGGSNGVGGTPARAGFTAGTGDSDAFFELPASGDQDAILALDEVAGNTGQIGQWFFPVRSGNIATADIPPLPDPAASGAVTGDPHLVTLDGLGYDFQATGEYVLSRSTDDPDFEIQARFVPIGENASATEAMATRLDGGSVMIDANDATPLQVDGAATELDDFSSVAVGNDAIFREGDRYTIVYAGDDGVVNSGDSRLVVDVVGGRIDFQARLNDDLAGSVEGLLGDGDGDQSNDVALQDGTVLARPFAFDELYGQYRDDWRVTDEAESLFQYSEDESLAGFYDEGHPASFFTVDDLDAETRAEAEQLASDAGLTPGTVSFNNAVLDFGLTGDSTFIDSAVVAPRVASSDFAPTEPDGDVPVDDDPGVLSGSVTDVAGNPLAGLDLAINGESAATDAAGDFTLSQGVDSSGTLTISDGSPSSIPDASDGSAILRMAMGLTDPDAFELIAADVDRDGAVTAADAQAVFRSSAGLEAEGATGQYVLLDGNGDYSGARLDDTGYTGGVDIPALSDDMEVSLMALRLGHMDQFDFA